MQKKIFVLVCALVIVLSGCSARMSNKSTPGIEEIRRTVEMEVDRREGAGFTSREIELQQRSGKWVAIVWRLPKVPGGSRVVTLDLNGQVIEYLKD